MTPIDVCVYFCFNIIPVPTMMRSMMTKNLKGKADQPDLSEACADLATKLYRDASIDTRGVGASSIKHLVPKGTKRAEKRSKKSVKRRIKKNIRQIFTMPSDEFELHLWDELHDDGVRESVTPMVALTLRNRG